MKNWKLFQEKYESDEDPFINDEEPSDEELSASLDGVDIEVDLEMEALCSMIRKYLKNLKLDVYVENQDEDLIIYLLLTKKEKISTLVKTLESLKNLQNEILPQYESVVELNKNKAGESYIIVTLTLDEDGDLDKDVE